MARSIGELGTAALDQARRETPWHAGEYLDECLNGKRGTYRERLDRQLKNYYGEVIPRIVIVRRNILRLGRRRPASRLPQ